MLRAYLGRRPYVASHLSHVELAVLAFIPQYIAFFLPATRKLVSHGWATAALISSLVLLTIFTWFNRRYVAFWLMGLGLVINLTVILLNHGLMPINPETVAKISPPGTAQNFELGSRLGGTKDIVLPKSETRLEWLADRFLLPSWVPNRTAFSLGDVFVTVGAFWFLWQAGRRQQPEKL